VIWVVLGVVAMSLVPKYEKIFHDFGASLPGMTVFLFNFNHVLGHYWYLAVSPLLVWPFVNYSVVSLLSPGPEVVIPKWLWYFATWGVILLVVVFAVVAIVLPLIELFTPPNPAPMPTLEKSRVGNGCDWRGRAFRPGCLG
jgi:type II secretory pathway component PulF